MKKEKEELGSNSIVNFLETTYVFFAPLIMFTMFLMILTLFLIIFGEIYPTGPSSQSKILKSMTPIFSNLDIKAFIGKYKAAIALCVMIFYILIEKRPSILYAVILSLFYYIILSFVEHFFNY